MYVHVPGQQGQGVNDS